MAVIPVPFTTANKKDLLLNVKELLDEGLIAINLERHTNLILALRTATATDLILDKEATTSDDTLDAFSLACYRVKVNRKETQQYDFGRHDNDDYKNRTRTKKENRKIEKPYNSNKQTE